MADLGSASIPAVDPTRDHVRGSASPPESEAAAPGPLVLVYADFECPFCAALHATLDELGLPVAFRHFPVRSSHPRAWPAACAAEAAARQDRFWEMHDALFADPARLEDPHLWDRAQRLGLDLERFDADRRDPAIRERVARDFRSGVRGGVVSTPTAFALIGDGTLAPVDRDAVAELVAPPR